MTMLEENKSYCKVVIINIYDPFSEFLSSNRTRKAGIGLVEL